MQAFGALSHEDINRLIMDCSFANNPDILQRLISSFTAEGIQRLNARQSAIAADIFRSLMSRAETNVRSVLAECLCHSHKLPVDIARKMAEDVVAVSTPILEHSEVLCDDDLLKLIASFEPAAKLEAIARRKAVSETVSFALVDTRVESVIGTLVHNAGAAISPGTFSTIVEQHSTSAIILEALSHRDGLPPEIVEAVMACISGPLRQAFEQKYGSELQNAEMTKAVNQSLELTSLNLMGLKMSKDEMAGMMTQLESSQTFSPIMALCMGDMNLFEVCMSRLLRVPVKQLQAHLHDPDYLRAAYARAALPEAMFEATALLITAIRQLDSESLVRAGQREIAGSFQIMDRLQLLAAGKNIEGVDYFCAILQHLTSKRVRSRMS